MTNTKFSIKDSHQAQAGGRGDGAGLATVFGGEDSLDIRRRPSSAANFDERADDIAYHIIQKAVGLHVKSNLVIFARNIALYYGSYGAFAVIGGGGEGLEVVHTQQNLCRGLHRFDIQRARTMPAIADLDYGANWAGVNRIAVDFAFRIADGVEGIRHMDGFDDGDVVGQHIIQRPRKIFRRHGAVDGKCGDLSQCVDACVRAGRAEKFHPTGGEFFDGVGQCALYCWHLRLCRPAVIGGAVVLD